MSPCTIIFLIFLLFFLIFTIYLLKGRPSNTDMPHVIYFYDKLLQIINFIPILIFLGTGLSIFLVNALRSVGIPSRVAGTPCWSKFYFG
jgi:hypothetical protein